MKLLPLLVTLLCACAPLRTAAQGADRPAAAELIVQLAGGVDGKLWAHRQPEIIAWKPLGYSMNAWLVETATPRAALLLRSRLLRDDSTVVYAQTNQRVQLRRAPDDARYAQQWQLRNTGQSGRPTGNDHRLEAAWDVTTGGLTPNGDTIVIASIDNGIDLDHEDLVDNIWINRDEIPGNGIDDDRNGYVDDVRGWNTDLETNDVEGQGGDHGTPVMGQMAARGNNGIGVTGVNWAVKVMTVTNNFRSTEAEVIQAYSYVLEARKRYDATGGREGAYVVATNASWGADRAFPSQSPIWCAIYDSLGAHGIINVAAVPNADVDVEEVGDLPSLCTSDYLVVVTSTNAGNRKADNAAAGALSVDLGAYGDGVYTTRKGNGYGEVTGTSYATPAVTGALGLLYSAPCGTFGELLRTDPAAAALYVKNTLLTSVRSVASLRSLTTSGGILDVGAAVRRLMAECGDCQAPTSFAVDFAEGEGDVAVLTWRATPSVTAVNLRFRRSGADEWTSRNDVASGYRLTDLPACAGYEFQLTAYCGTDSVRSAVRSVQTPGCCRLPTDFRTTALPGARILAEWEPLPAAVSYTLRYRTEGEGWTELTTTASALELTDLRNCRNYELALRTNCGSDTASFRGQRFRKTLGCGVCLDVTYCAPRGFDSNQEWIERVSIPGVLSVGSEREASGYRNFGDLTQRAMVPGGVYTIRLTPGFRGNGFSEDFHVYVDWDQDGQFAREELIVQQSTATRGIVEADFAVPDDVRTGLTRMRVVMQFNSVTTDGCANNGDRTVGGEVEDYCLDVSEARGCPPPDSVAAVYSGTAEATRLEWGASAAPGGSYHLRYRERTVAEFTERVVDGLGVEIPGANLCNRFEFQIASVCDGEAGAYRTVSLGDNCVGTRELRLPDAVWSVSPNPATRRARIGWEREIDAERLICYGADGRKVREIALRGGDREIELPVGDLPTGLYVLRLLTRDGRSGVRRLVVSR